MVRLMRSCVQSILKLVNSVVGMVGLAMVLYAVWLIKAWQREIGEFPFGEDENYPAPWFIYSFLGLGATLCVITCLGHVSAETANGCCLYLYMMVMFVLVMVEAAVTADVFLNRDWEKDFPKDPSGSFDKFKDFIRLHFEICKWVGLSIVAVQVSSPSSSQFQAVAMHLFVDCLLFLRSISRIRLDFVGFVGLILGV
ncbi:unnamed protein product [Linum trigynum]|uniref:Tetraspanin-19 n=1 Tax=Linum trigynum TaxID=586398 RepID=A0AAV2G7E6_9ROSI